MFGTPTYSPNGKDRRRHRRDSLSAIVTVLWGRSADHEELAQARLVDISPKGGRFRIGIRIPVGSWFMFNYQKEGVQGRGTVRHCRMAKGMFEVGVEFPNGTGWNPKKADATTAIERLRKALGPAPAEAAAESTIEVCPPTTRS